MDYLVIVQARLDSQRLPGKALLWTPFGPLAVVSALRSSGPEHRTVLATTEDKEGGYLSAIAELSHVDSFRGSKDDVLGRFHGASLGLGDSTYIVRLTADNIVPDAELISECVACAADNQLGYLTTVREDVPYGLSVEVFTKELLNAAHQEATDRADREHVKP